MFGRPSLSVTDASDLRCVKELIMVSAHMSHKVRHNELNSESNDKEKNKGKK